MLWLRGRHQEDQKELIATGIIAPLVAVYRPEFATAVSVSSSYSTKYSPYLGEQLRRRSPPRFILEIDIGELLCLYSRRGLRLKHENHRKSV
jgi:hypothetical protein